MSIIKLDNEQEKEKDKKTLSDNQLYYRAVGFQAEHSLTTVIPSAFGKAIGLKKGDFLKVTIDDQNRIIMEKADK